jgi:predicted amidohydrolase YtcJ
MIRVTFIAFASWVLVACSGSDSETGIGGSVVARSTSADLVFTNGRIYTVNENTPWVEAVAIRDGEFIVVGSNASVAAVTGTETQVIDLRGQFVMPGLHDAHVHLEAAYAAPMLAGSMLTYGPDQNTIEQLQKTLAGYAESQPDLPVLFVEQLPLEIFPNQSPTKAFIDEVVSDRPVVMLTNTEHEALLNSKALAMEGITANTLAPKGGELIKDPDTGEPTGFMTETAAGKWGWKHFPELSRENHEKGMLGTIKYLNSVGITSVKQVHAKRPVATALLDLESDGSLAMRVALAWTYKGPLEPMPLEDQAEQLADRARFDTALINPDFVKMSIDGNLGTTGLTIEPYVITGDYGISAIELEELTVDLGRFDAMGLGLVAHATGDGAARRLLDAMQVVRGQQGELKGRHQLGHAISIHPDDLPRLVELNLTPEFSPVLWAPNAYIDAIAANVGKDRMSRLFPMRSVHEAGGRVVIGSDGPLFWRDPLETLEAAVTRQSTGGSDRELASGEAIDLATAIRAMTINAAYILDQENIVGSIEAGKRADMIVLNRNLFEIPPTEIGSVTVQLTVFDGKLVYDRASDPTGEDAIEEEYGVDLQISGDEGYRGNFVAEEAVKNDSF